MKQELNPRILVVVIAIGVVVLGLIGWRVWSAPSVTPVPEVAQAASSGGATGDAQAGTARGGGRMGGGGPTADALKAREEYNRAHPEAAGGH